MIAGSTPATASKLRMCWAIGSPGDCKSLALTSMLVQVQPHPPVTMGKLCVIVQATIRLRGLPKEQAHRECHVCKVCKP